MFFKVHEFHTAFKVSMATSPQFPTGEIRELRVNILDEEYKEYLHAVRTDNLVEIADALADIAYIAVGTLLVYGLKQSEKFSPVFADHPINGSAALVDADLARTCEMTVSRHFAAYLESERQNDLQGIKVALLDLLDALSAVAYTYSIPLTAVFNEVHASNMSKLGEDGKPVYRTDGKILKGPNFFRPDIKAVLNV